MKTIHCPDCQHQMQAKTKGFFKKHIILPDFCGSCGVKFHVFCPDCGTDIETLERFCRDCGVSLYHSKQSRTPDRDISVPALESKVSKQQQQYIHVFRRDLEDKILLFRETLIVIWRLNPITIGHPRAQILINSIYEGMERPKIAAIIEEAIALIEFSQAPTVFAVLHQAYLTLFDDLLHSGLRDSCQVYTSLESYFSTAVKADYSTIVKDLGEMMDTAFLRQAPLIDRNTNRYNQLHEFYPRLHKILNRSFFMDFIVGFAAGFIGGDAGVAGAEVWENWRKSSDNDFIDLFTRALVDFIDGCAEFKNNTEAALMPTFERFLDEYRRDNEVFISSFEQLALKGWDLAPIYNKSREVVGLDEDTKTIFTHAINNLRANPQVESKRLNNIRNMLGIMTE